MSKWKRIIEADSLEQGKLYKFRVFNTEEKQEKQLSFRKKSTGFGEDAFVLSWDDKTTSDTLFSDGLMFIEQIMGALIFLDGEKHALIPSGWLTKKIDGDNELRIWKLVE